MNRVGSRLVALRRVFVQKRNGGGGHGHEVNPGPPITFDYAPVPFQSYKKVHGELNGKFNLYLAVASVLFVASFSFWKMSLIDPSYELIDPCPDIFALFKQFDATFFWSELACCEVKWSPRMTSCAGICVYEGRGGLCSIRLSKPLLTLRPRKDLVETLLHEMIHAYLFVTQRFSVRDGADGHGPMFQEHMGRINVAAGTRITIYHSFHAEVASFKQHWWRCEGQCREHRPFYGWVKRATNRAPGPNDSWWDKHKNSCGGKFEKVKEPDGYANKKKQKEKTVPKMQTLDKYFSPSKELPAPKNFVGKGTTLDSTQRDPSTPKTNKANGSIFTGKEPNMNEARGRSRLLSLYDNERSNPMRTQKDTCKDTVGEVKIPESRKRIDEGDANSSKPLVKRGKQIQINDVIEAFTGYGSFASTSQSAAGNLEMSTAITNFGNELSAQEEPALQAFPDWTLDELNEVDLGLLRSPSYNSNGENEIEILVQCPACQLYMSRSEINSHLDRCLD
ncbi:unnamed protein product, partial [Mesorhabditis belari]|uniref:Protein with SprT-like domain at the N terminus n=1 Tax=Mesorhabditis belari TaxID=2138241 RepID=A0AAF3F2G1_9BILA